MTNHDELCEKDGEKDFHGLFSSELHELRQENKELRTRMAELEGKYEKAIDGFNFQLDMRVKSDKKNESLQTRLSTLLKASEGMEKALERMPCTCNEFEDPIPHQSSEDYCPINIAKLALADFRAVKEGL